MNEPNSLMGYFMMTAGVSAIGYVVFFIRPRVRACRTWPSVRGTIIKSGAITKSGATGYDNPNTVYQADVAYDYRVRGRSYVGTDIRPGGTIALSIPRQARTVATNYSVGREVDVFFNPSRPDESYLDRTDEVSWFYVLIGTVFILAGWLVS